MGRARGPMRPKASAASMHRLVSSRSGTTAGAAPAAIGPSRAMAWRAATRVDSVPSLSRSASLLIRTAAPGPDRPVALAASRRTVESGSVKPLASTSTALGFSWLRQSSAEADANLTRGVVSPRSSVRIFPRRRLCGQGLATRQPIRRASWHPGPGAASTAPEGPPRPPFLCR